MSRKTVVQLNNQYIQDEHLRQRYQDERNRKNNRLMGFILVGIILLLILPTYKLYKSYLKLQKNKIEVVKLEKKYSDLKSETKAQKTLAKQLKNEEYVAKYARAKYYLSKTGEVIYPVPNFIPK